jgi:hypothetical protein
MIMAEKNNKNLAAITACERGRWRPGHRNHLTVYIIALSAGIPRYVTLRTFYGRTLPPNVAQESTRMRTMRDNVRTHADASLSDLNGRVFLGSELKPAVRERITLDWLVSQYGYGDQPGLRQRCYAAIIAACDANGPPAVKLVADVARSARNARDPARYFLCVATRRLREVGFDC